MMLGDVRRSSSRIGSPSGTEAENVALDQLWVNLLRLRLLDEALDFCKRVTIAASH